MFLWWVNLNFSILSSTPKCERSNLRRYLYLWLPFSTSEVVAMATREKWMNWKVSNEADSEGCQHFMSVGGGICGIMSVVNFGKLLAIINSDINISSIIFSLLLPLLSHLHICYTVCNHLIVLDIIIPFIHLFTFTFQFRKFLLIYLQAYWFFHWPYLSSLLMSLELNTF